MPAPEEAVDLEGAEAAEFRLQQEPLADVRVGVVVAAPEVDPQLANGLAGPERDQPALPRAFRIGQTADACEVLDHPPDGFATRSLAERLQQFLAQPLRRIGAV